MTSELDRAWVLIGLDRLDAAREQSALVLAGQPDNPDALAIMAYVTHKSGQYERAAEYAGSALAQDPTYEFAWRVKALATLELARAATPGAERDRLYAQAESFARGAVDNGPEQAENHRVMALVLRDTNPAAALEVLDHALELDPEDVNVHVARAVVLRYQLRDFDGADAALNTALQLDPEHAAALHELALNDIDLNRPESAKRRLHLAAQLDPRRGADVREALNWLAADQARRRADHNDVARPVPAHSSATPAAPAKNLGWVLWGVIVLIGLLVRAVWGASDSDSPRDSPTSRYPAPTIIQIPSQLRNPPTFRVPNFPTRTPNWSNFPRSTQIGIPPTPR
ncbi:hypothetical protein [Nocardia sp. NPDC051832]|uniref:tetratricopeptide repeat protein n=1 Tax=Nocardia sp. NPDC051832 TaxID=3155673 RepID=UPI003431DF88